MDSEWPPTPPGGYRKHDPEYDPPGYVTAALYGWFFGMSVAIPMLAIRLKGFTTMVRAASAIAQYDSFSEWLMYFFWVLGMIVVTAILHEGIHAICSRWFGFRTKFDLEHTNLVNITPTTLTYGGFQSRTESLVIMLAPLIVLTPVSFLVLAASSNAWILASAAFVALANTAGAVGDLASAWLIWKLPVGELIYHGREGQQQYYRQMSE